MDLFAPVEPCPECKRPLPVPFEDNYQHWDGCQAGIQEAERAAMHCHTCGGPCDGPCEEGDEQFESMLVSMLDVKRREALEALYDAVKRFISDIYWDETGDGNNVAVFSTEQVNDLCETFAKIKDLKVIQNI